MDPNLLTVGEVTARLNAEHGLPEVAPNVVSMMIYNRSFDTTAIITHGRNKLIPASLVPVIAARLKNRRRYGRFRQPAVATVATDLAIGNEVANSN